MLSQGWGGGGGLNFPLETSDQTKGGQDESGKVAAALLD